MVESELGCRPKAVDSEGHHVVGRGRTCDQLAYSLAYSRSQLEPVTCSNRDRRTPVLVAELTEIGLHIRMENNYEFH